MPIADLGHYAEHQHHYNDMPVDPQIMEDIRAYTGEQIHQFEDDGVQQHHLHQYAAHADSMDVGVQGYYDVDVGQEDEESDAQQLHEQLNAVAGSQREWLEEKGQ